MVAHDGPSTMARRSRRRAGPTTTSTRFQGLPGKPSTFPNWSSVRQRTSRVTARPQPGRGSRVSCSRYPTSGAAGGSWPAATYEDVLSKMVHLRRSVTLPAAIAMSGAALSPEMGRMTRAPLRFLLTMFNIRLGVWIPNPNRLAEFELRNGSGWRRLWMNRESSTS